MKPAETAPIPLRRAGAFWLKLGCISFGGPAGQIAVKSEHRRLASAALGLLKSLL